jgi:uncharacterized membrane protein YhfC
MAVSAILSIGIPVCLFFYFRKKYDIQIIPCIIGACAFIIFALFLEQFLHKFVLYKTNIKENYLLYIIYATFSAGIFEETARFLSFKFLKRNYFGVKTALSYGIGHGGIESILIAGASMIAAIVYSVMINTANIEIITAQMSVESAQKFNVQIGILSSTKPSMFLFAGIERMFAVIIQISLSIFVYYSVYSSKKFAYLLYPAAIFIHALINVSAAAFQINIIKSVYAVEIILVFIAGLLAFFTFKLHEKIKEE